MTPRFGVLVAAFALAASARDAASEPVSIPAACYVMGCSGKGCSDALPEQQVCVDAFAIDATEVTVAAYQACVDAGTCKAVPKSRGPRVCNSVVGGRDQHPVNCVSWVEANAYCEWKGQRLPTEAEWELAARGKVGWTYPWGAGPPTCELGVISGCKHTSMLPVGSRPTGNTALGVSDLAGNAFEWVSDWYAPTRKVSETPLDNPRGPCDGKATCRGKRYRVIKGGHYGSAHPLLAGWARYFVPPKATYPFLGFRCAG